MDILLPWQRKHALITLLFEGIRTSYYCTHSLRQQQSLVKVVAMDTLLPWQQKQVLTTLLFEGIKTSFLCTHSLRQQQSLVKVVAMDTLLSWQQKQVVIALLFEDIQTSYLVQMFLKVLVISGISCCYGHNVTMPTEACTCNNAV